MIEKNPVQRDRVLGSFFWTDGKLTVRIELHTGLDGDVVV